MATGTAGGRSYPQPITEASHRGAPAPNIGTAVSPPSKRELASWWKKFRKTTEKEEEKVVTPPGIFGVPLAESIRYANVAISLTNEQGESFIYGYVPIIVAKCGVFLKEKATDVEGIFRLSGSAKRIKDLQTIFNSPERYGKGLDWTGYTVHDAANILRRYLNNLPEPIVPLHQYERFRDPLRSYQQRLEKRPEGQPTPEISATEHENAVKSYQKLITELPALNRQLLLYILDLLAVFSSKSDLNRMTAANLAAIFQPGIISHPDHYMAPQEYRLSQDVLIFLIENQDNFLIGMSGTGLDERTQRDVENGPPAAARSPVANIGRSASNASAGADSLRRYGIRRNVSVSSHASRERTSPNVSSPGTPASPAFSPSGGSIGVARSNTVPSKRSPAIGQHRFQRKNDTSSSSSPIVANTSTRIDTNPVTPEKKTAPPATSNAIVQQPRNDSAIESAEKGSEAATVPFPVVSSSPPVAESQRQPPQAQSIVIQVPKTQPTEPTQTRERKISNLFARSPIFGPMDNQHGGQARQPKKLQKRQKLPGTLNESAQSSAASLQGEDNFQTPLMSPDLSHSQTDPMAIASTPNNQNQLNGSGFPLPPHANDIHGRGSMVQKSPAASLRSGTSMTDPSDFDALEDPATKAEKVRRRWRFSSSARKTDDNQLFVPPPPIGQIPGARNSNSSINSYGRPRQSFAAESHLTQQLTNDHSSIGHPSVTGQSSHESQEPLKEITSEPERKGLFGKLKAKMAQSKEERREREAEKERAKSPPRIANEHASSRQSLSAFAHEHLAQRGRSIDKPREEVLPKVTEKPFAEAVQSRGSVSTINSQAPLSIVAPQTTSLTTPMPPVPPIPATLVNTSATSAANPTVSTLLASGEPGPAVVPATVPATKEESHLTIDTKVDEASQPDSLQHTPTEIKGMPLEK